MHIKKNYLNFIDSNNVELLKDIEITPFPIFSDQPKLFLSELSKALFNLDEIRKYEDISSFAFWCRKSNLEKITSDYKSSENYIGRGLAFHISPSNVPVNFAFTFAFGLLSGCSNIVRVPSKNSPQIEIITSEIFNLLNKDKFKRISSMNRLITYKKDQFVTEYLSKLANARIIWGGDETIKQVKKFPTKPRCIDICFSDRYSFTIINALAFLKVTIQEKKNIAKKFYNDSFLNNQNACSSPHLIIWEGNKDDCDLAKSTLWKEVLDIIYQKIPIEKSEVMEKYRHLCKTSINFKDELDINWDNNMIYRLNLNSLSNDFDKFKFRSGFFFEYTTNNIEEIWETVTEKYQTLSYFGLNAESIYKSMTRANSLGIDRIVPIGKSLQIGHIWDGFDIIQTLARKVIIEK